MPSLNTVYRWRQDNEAFARQYAIAREFHAETLADKIRETIDGAEGCTMEEIQARRLKFDGYRYLAARYFPRMFGDKLIHTGGDGEGPVAVKLIAGLYFTGAAGNGRVSPDAGEDGDGRMGRL